MHSVKLENSGSESQGFDGKVCNVAFSCYGHTNALALEMLIINACNPLVPGLTPGGPTRNANPHQQ